jgi:hypothetical protein
MAKYYKRFDQNGVPFYVSESGDLVSEAIARKNLHKDHKFKEVFVETVSEPAKNSHTLSKPTKGSRTQIFVEESGSKSAKDSHAALKESFIAAGLSEKDAEIAATGRRNASESTKLEIEEVFRHSTKR